MKDDRMLSDRAGSSRTPAERKHVGVNLPAVHFKADFQPSSPPPQPLDIEQLCHRADAEGFADAYTDEARHLLGRMSYQHLSRYFDLVKDENGNLIDGASLSLVNSIAIFDREFQALLLKNIGLFEIKFRAQYSYALSLERGAFAHRNPKNFKSRPFFDRFLDDYSREFNHQLKKGNQVIINAFEKYGDAPTWAAVEIMSVGTLSMLYKNTRSRAVRESVASSFGATVEEFSSWARAISTIRNVCAHFGKLCGSKLVSMPKKIPGIEGDNSKPFYMILLLIYLFKSSRTFPEDPEPDYMESLLEDFLRLCGKASGILPLCGFPSDWAEQTLSKRITGEKWTLTSIA